MLRQHKQQLTQRLRNRFRLHGAALVPTRGARRYPASVFCLARCTASSKASPLAIQRRGCKNPRAVSVNDARIHIAREAEIVGVI